MEQIAGTELTKVPYLRCTADGRTVPLQSYWDGEGWHLWLSDGRGGLIAIRPVDCAAGIYVAKAPSRETDLHVPFLDFMWKHASWPDIARWLVAIENDVVKLSASLAKIDHFEECGNLGSAHRFELDVFVATEIEYLFSRCRSVFDHLQHVVAGLWQKTLLLDEGDARKKKLLPPSTFRKAAQAIRDRPHGAPVPYGLPVTIATAYASVADFFFSLRKLRDSLVHHGGEVGRIYATDRGFGIEPGGPLARISADQAAGPPINPNLIGLRASLAHVVCGTLGALEPFADAFRRVIKFPDSLIPDHQLFLRTSHATALITAQKLLADLKPTTTT